MNIERNKKRLALLMMKTDEIHVPVLQMELDLPLPSVIYMVNILRVMHVRLDIGKVSTEKVPQKGFWRGGEFTQPGKVLFAGLI